MCKKNKTKWRERCVINAEIFIDKTVRERERERENECERKREKNRKRRERVLEREGGERERDAKKDAFTSAYTHTHTYIYTYLSHLQMHARIKKVLHGRYIRRYIDSDSSREDLSNLILIRETFERKIAA